MRQKRLIRKIQEILVKYTPVKVWATIRDSGESERSEIHYQEAKEIAGLLKSSQNVSQLQQAVYDIFVQYHEYSANLEDVWNEIATKIPAQVERSNRHEAGTLEDYATIAQEVFALKAR